MILEDLFVIDAPALWCERDRAGNLLGLHPLDGATIKPVLDFWGRTPRPFMQDGQKNLPRRLPANSKRPAGGRLHHPRHHLSPAQPAQRPRLRLLPGRTDHRHGQIGLKRQLHQLNYYTEGNIPESLIGVPNFWTPDQIKNFQDYWDLYFDGDLARRRRAKFVPGGVAKTFIQTKEPELKNAFDEWIARVVCFAFSVSPQPFINQMNRSTSETQKPDVQRGRPANPSSPGSSASATRSSPSSAPENLEFAWRNEAVDRSHGPARKSGRPGQRGHDDPPPRRPDHGRNFAERCDGRRADGHDGAGGLEVGLKTRFNAINHLLRRTTCEQDHER